MSRPPTKTFCIYPWVHGQIDIDGSFLTCCEVPLAARLGQVKSDSLEDIWNSSQMKGLRKKFLDGEVPKQCESCFFKESQGHESDRLKANNWYANYFDHVEKTETDGSLPLDCLKSLDFRVSNVCNYRCRTCTPAASSALAKDWVFISKDKRPPIVKKAFANLGEFDGYFKNVVSQIDRLYFAGGEPFLQEEHFHILEKFIQSGRSSEAELFYNTNLSTVSYKGQKVANLWQHFSKVSLSLSIDGTYQQGAYIRDGFDWEKFKENIQELEKSNDNIDIFYNITVSNFNGLYLPEIIADLKKELNAIDDHIYFNPVSDPSYYSLNNLPSQLKKDVQHKLEDYCLSLGTSILLDRVSAINKLISPEANERDLLAFKQMTKRIDQVRGQSFSKVFPELSSLIL